VLSHKLTINALRSSSAELLLRFWNSHHERLLRLSVGKMDERRRRILGEVFHSGFHDRTLLSNDRPGDSLARSVRHCFQGLNLAGRRVLERA